jgi:hypothetical protein
MQELVKVTTNSEGTQLANARGLYNWLEIEDHFTQQTVCLNMALKKVLIIRQLTNMLSNKKH